jgi:hypothetical protein
MAIGRKVALPTVNPEGIVLYRHNSTGMHFGAKGEGDIRNYLSECTELEEGDHILCLADSRIRILDGSGYEIYAPCPSSLRSAMNLLEQYSPSTKYEVAVTREVFEAAYRMTR